MTRGGRAPYAVRLTRRAAGALAALALPVLIAASADAATVENPVLRWNQAAIDSIITTRTSPPIAARAFAILHTCIFDAWAAYAGVAAGIHDGASLNRQPEGRTAADPDISINAAAYQALSDLFPSQQLTRLDPMMHALGLDPSDQSVDTTTPAGLGRAVCQAVLDSRHHDGSNQLGDLNPGAYSDYTGYSPVNSPQRISTPARWQPLVVNDVTQVWQLAHWNRVTPFGLESASRFRSLASSSSPVQPGTVEFLRQTRALIEISATLGDREKVIAEYWADGAGTATPPGHWNLIAQLISRRDGHTTADDAKLFFVLGNALLDASIAAWDTKRAADSVRPVTAVRLLMGRRQIAAWAGPGLGTQVIDCKDFRSYLPTPAFPSYVSGHSAFSAAAAEILKRATGSDRFGGSFVAPPGSSLIERGLTPATSVTLAWATFSQAAEQAGMSRRYGGIHFESDDLAGQTLGRAVADAVWVKAMGYIGRRAPGGAY
jgi:hypothetical protein